MGRYLSWGALSAALLMVGCNSDTADGKAETSTPRDRISITSVVESVKTGDPSGIDPETWKLASDPAAVLPAGATIEVVDGSWVINESTATVDAVVTAADGSVSRHWVFLRKDGIGWLITGTLPLDTVT